MINWNKQFSIKRNQEDTPKMKFGGNQLQKLQGKERQQLRREKEEFG